jgi:hypothetical protein
MPSRLLFGLLFTGALLGADTPAAEVKVGLGIEKFELTGEAATLKVEAGTKIYAWTKVTAGDAKEDASVEIVFERDGKAAFRQKLALPHIPYRTNAYRTFQAGDAGAWTAKVVDGDGKELGSAAFTVEITGK